MLQANDYISLWRFGSVTPYYPVPPSIAGEFYMQGGVAALIALSAAFGLVLRWSRRRIATAKTLGGVWVISLLTFQLLVDSLTEFSILATFVLFTLLPIWLGYRCCLWGYRRLDW